MRLDKNNPPESIVFNGITFKRMGGSRGYYLSQSTTTAGRKKPKGLHVAIWEYHSGVVCPQGHEINHQDGDTFNCEPDNLECLPKAIHRSRPKKLDMEKIRANLDRQRPKASAWHGSPAGREWHRKHAAEVAKKIFIPKNYTCVQCSTDFIATRPAGARYCSSLCGERYRRKLAKSLQSNG